jgi:nucleotide-binding universal stress UspA family protein
MYKKMLVPLDGPRLAEVVLPHVEALARQRKAEAESDSDIHPQLIAMSTHGRSGFSRFVFGNVTENMVRRLKKTLLFLVRPAAS